jgi:hypothetical protein
MLLNGGDMREDGIWRKSKSKTGGGKAHTFFAIHTFWRHTFLTPLQKNAGEKPVLQTICPCQMCSLQYF